jgi:transcriptional regulator with XRE-family HTH domain
MKFWGIHGMINSERFYHNIGQNIKVRREQLGLTQEALAAQVALTRTSITNIEKGRQKLLLHTFMDIVAALGVGPVSLLPQLIEESHEDLSKLKGAPIGKREQMEWIKTTVESTQTEDQL